VGELNHYRNVFLDGLYYEGGVYDVFTGGRGRGTSCSSRSVCVQHSTGDTANVKIGFFTLVPVAQHVVQHQCEPEK